MLDAKLIRNEPDAVRQALTNRKGDVSYLDRFIELDEQRRKTLWEVEALKAERNKVSEEIAKMKKDKQDATSEIERMREVSQRIKQMDADVAEVEAQLSDIILNLPNLAHESVPVGEDDSANVIQKSWGEPRTFDFEPIPHWDLATALDMIDFERGSKISGSGFILYKGLGARLERSLINWMLDVHTKEHNYIEVYPPFLINRKSMTGTGQLPKFEEDMYHTDKEDDLFFNPTAEVPLTNIYGDEILDADMLPVYFTAWTACFRREAGSAGKDTRGILRVHQFDKVEMVKLAKPETSYEEHEKMLADAEDILQRLNIPYRVVVLSTGDMGFSAAKCYDIEIWAPGVGKWLEVSSVSNCEDFQARRASIRYRPEPGAKPEFVHTLNGSGVALPRLVVSILETYQNADGTISVPDVLKPYMGVDAIGESNAGGVS